MNWEYGIRHKKTSRIHRTGYTEAQAQEFMDPASWDGLDPSNIFEVIRRPVVDEWEVVEENEE
jgi:hypothetical protein